MTPSNTDLREALEQLVWDEGDEPTLINQILALFQAREQQIFTELLGELPRPTAIWHEDEIRILDQVIEIIERLQNKTNDGGSDE